MSKIVGDSCCEVTPEMIGNQETVLVPFSLTIGDQTYIDDENLDVKHFLKEMKAYPETPKSGCPTPFEFEKAIGDSLSTFLITISAKLSGTYDSAMVAAKNVQEKFKEAKVHVFDSMSAAAGETLIYLKIKEMLQKEFSFEEIVEKIEHFIKQDMATLVVLESLDNLVKNGRMSKIAGTIASFLSIHPILWADQGEIGIFDKTVGMKKALSKLVDSIGRVCNDVSERILVITHCNNRERAELIKDKVEQQYRFRQIYINETRGLGTLYANDGGVILAF